MNEKQAVLSSLYPQVPAQLAADVLDTIFADFGVTVSK